MCGGGTERLRIGFHIEGTAAFVHLFQYISFGQLGCKGVSLYPGQSCVTWFSIESTYILSPKIQVDGKNPGDRLLLKTARLLHLTISLSGPESRNCILHWS